MIAESDGIALHKRKSAPRSTTRRTTSATNLIATELTSPGGHATAMCLIAHIDFPSSGLSHESGAQITRPDIVPLISAVKPMAPSLDNSCLISSGCENSPDWCTKAGKQNFVPDRRHPAPDLQRQSKAFETG